MSARITCKPGPVRVGNGIRADVSIDTGEAELDTYVVEALGQHMPRYAVLQFVDWERRAELMLTGADAEVWRQLGEACLRNAEALGQTKSGGEP